MAKAKALDLWIQATTAPDEIDHPLVLARSSVDDVFRATKLKPRDFVREDLPDDGWQRYQSDTLQLLFFHGIWHGLAYGLQVDGLTWQVEATAFRERAPLLKIVDGQIQAVSPPYEQITVGRLPIHMMGKDISSFVRLPDFVALTSSEAFASLGKPTQWQMIGREYEKWLRLSIDLPSGSVTAEFLLKTGKGPYQGYFEIDYFLSRLSLYSTASSGP